MSRDQAGETMIGQTCLTVRGSRNYMRPRVNTASGHDEGTGFVRLAHSEDTIDTALNISDHSPSIASSMKKSVPLSVAMQSGRPSSNPQSRVVPSWCQGASRPKKTGRSIWEQPDFSLPVGQGCSACAERGRTCYVRVDRRSCASCTAQGNSRGLCNIDSISFPSRTNTLAAAMPVAPASVPAYDALCILAS